MCRAGASNMKCMYNSTSGHTVVCIEFIIRYIYADIIVSHLCKTNSCMWHICEI